MTATIFDTVPAPEPANIRVRFIPHDADRDEYVIMAGAQARLIINYHTVNLGPSPNDILQGLIVLEDSAAWVFDREGVLDYLHVRLVDEHRLHLVVANDDAASSLSEPGFPLVVYVNAVVSRGQFVRELYYELRRLADSDRIGSHVFPIKPDVEAWVKADETRTNGYRDDLVPCEFYAQ